MDPHGVLIEVIGIFYFSVTISNMLGLLLEMIHYRESTNSFDDFAQ